MSRTLSPERELLSAQIRGAWQRVAEFDATEAEHAHLLQLLERLAPGQDQTLVDSATTRFAGEMHHPNPMKAEVARAMLLLFFEGKLDLASISEAGEFVWTITDLGLEEDVK